MSTKIPLKAGEDLENGASFQLYIDCIDEMADIDLIYLDLEGVPFEVTAGKDRQAVTLRIPRALAIQLGLVSPGEGPA